RRRRRHCFADRLGTTSPLRVQPSIVGLHAIQLCRNVLVSPRGATDVRCAICGTTTAAPPIGTCLASF
ncbi:unnamed protein product, partial [Musa textilis]